MARTQVYGGAIVTTMKMTFNCPKCSCRHTESDWADRVNKSKQGIIYRKCKGCKTRLGVSTDMMGDVVVWLKEDEEK